MADDVVVEHAGAVHRRDLARLLRLVVALAFIVVLVLVGFDNRSTVRVGYVVGDGQAPVWVVVLGAALAGMVIAALARRRHS
jgi:MYXO-CTERM domain-containing protein